MQTDKARVYNPSRSYKIRNLAFVSLLLLVGFGLFSMSEDPSPALFWVLLGIVLCGWQTGFVTRVLVDEEGIALIRLFGLFRKKVPFQEIERVRTGLKTVYFSSMGSRWAHNLIFYNKWGNILLEVNIDFFGQNLEDFLSTLKYFRVEIEEK